MLAVGAALGACGGESPATSERSEGELDLRIDRARRVSAADFPAPGGRSLQEIADGAEAGRSSGSLTSVFVPGRNRLALGVLGADNEPVYGRSAVYVVDNEVVKGLWPGARCIPPAQRAVAVHLRHRPA